jgi:hypothetical protein
MTLQELEAQVNSGRGLSNDDARDVLATLGARVEMIAPGVVTDSEATFDILAETLESGNPEAAAMLVEVGG